MSSPVQSLCPFVRPVATCAIAANLATVLAQLQTDPDESIAVVNDRGAPLGLLRPARLLKYVGRSPLPDLATLLDPIAVVPVDIAPIEVGAYVNSTAAACAVVAADGRLLGLLDSRQVLATLLAPPHPASPPIGMPPPLAAALSPAQASSLELMPSRTLVLAPLLQLLEHLPLPLMMQDASGRAIAQNDRWREEICPRCDGCPLIGEQKAPLASAGVPPTADAPLQQWCNLSDPRDLGAKAATIASTALVSASAFYDPPAACSNSCAFCADGERARACGAWQFAKLPLSGPTASALGWESPLPTVATGPLWLVLATDISEQRQLCRELAAKNADLVQLNRLKDEFLACISHELKSPLTAVVGLSSLLKEQTLGKLNQRQERYTGLIYQSGRQLMTLVNDILDLTRLESGQLKLNPQSVSLADVCDRAYRDAAAALIERGQSDLHVGFSLEVEPGLERIVADDLRLRQLLVHLLSNALKFTKAGGKVGLRVNHWEGWVAFAVWDTGIGIPAGSQHMIFQKFQQLENPLTRQFEGSGLGLVLAQRLARAHGGDITFISEVGKGSEFTLLMPPCPPPDNRYPARGGSTVGRSKLVLAIEAVPQYIDNLNGQLRQLGYRVAIARSGTEALEKARTFQPRAILLNPLLPQLSGWDVLTLLKADARTREIPVLVTSTSAEKDRAIACGANGFLNLPVDGDSLRRYLDDEQEIVATPANALNDLTVLQLTVGTYKGVADLHNTERELVAQLGQLGYRVLEADDLDQADLLARIWRPDAIVLVDTDIPLADLKRLTGFRQLAALPLVILDAATAQRAHHLGTLSVFPCLAAPNASQVTALRSAVRVAANAGANSAREEDAPHILVADARETHAERSSEWLQALTQYLETAGYRSSLARTWTETYRQIHHHSIDLLLLDCGMPPWDATAIAALKELLQQYGNLPVVALASQADAAAIAPDQIELLQQVATHILPGHSQSMVELLAQIDLALELPSDG
ncbi:ATP-binding response regulator [Rubidibacter lacunae]|nr:ATP-binding protein [Rubidibacter lacunae]